MRRNLLSKAVFLAVVSFSSMPFAQAQGGGIWVEGTLQNSDFLENVSASITAPMSASGKTSAGILIKGEGREFKFGGEFLTVNINDENIKQTAGIAINSGAKAEFSADNISIDVHSKGSSGYWGFGFIAEGDKTEAVFSGKDVSISTHQENYTSQSLTVASGALINFENTGNVVVNAFSNFGVTAVDAKGTLIFNNDGNVVLTGEILPGDTTGQTNVVGMQGVNGKWTVTDKVKDFVINLKGAGVDNDGTSYSTGTKGIAAEGSDMRVAIDSENFVINMDIASDVVDDSPEGHTSELAYGIELEKFATLNVGSSTSTSINIKEGLGSGYGVSVTSGAQATFDGNTSIQISAKEDAIAVEVDGSDTAVSFNGKHNEMVGDIKVSSASEISFANGLTEIDGKVLVDSSSVANLNDAIWNLSKDSTIAIEGALSSTNGEIVLNQFESGAVRIANLTQGSNLTVAASGELNDQLGSDIETFSQSVNIGSGAQGVSLFMKEGLVSDAISAQLGQDGSLDQTSISTKKNTLMQSTLELASAAPLALNRIMMNDVRKRLGDIRTTEGTHGVWARYDGGKLSGEGGLKNDFNTIQVGIDTVPTEGSARVGVAFSYTNSDAEYARGNADMKAYSIAMYGTKVFDNGMFVDVIGRMGTADTDLTVDGQHKGSLDNVVLGVSGEFGWRFDVTDSMYIEPQAEISYAYVDDDKLTLSTANYNVDSVNSLLGRVGFAAGLKCPSDKGNVYVRASAVHEFLGDSKITGMNAGHTNVYEIDGKDTWVEYGLGANFNVTKSTYMWADVERTTGGALDEDWRATVGVRYAW